MRRALAAGVAVVLAGCAGMGGAGGGYTLSGPLKVVSESRVAGLVFPESVGCDAREKVVYVSQFGGTKLQPGEKDGLGFISKLSADGQLLEQRVFKETLDKPKGIWIEGGRLWTTDIDSVWIFDLGSKKGRKVMLPGAQFANDPAVRAGVLYVSDNRSDQLFRVEPADFLDAAVQPKVSTVVKDKGINPNGLWPARNGTLLMAGFMAPDQSRGLHAMGRDGDVKPLSKPMGRLDGLHELADGSLLVTDWNTGSLFRWTEKGGMETLAKGFKGPADFCVMGDTAYVPDLVGSEMRIIKLDRAAPRAP